MPKEDHRAATALRPRRESDYDTKTSALQRRKSAKHLGSPTGAVASKQLTTSHATSLQVPNERDRIATKE